MQKFCTKCGASLNPNARFCVKCGTAIVNKEIKETPVPQKRNVNNKQNVVNSLRGKGVSIASTIFSVSRKHALVIPAVLIISGLGFYFFSGGDYQEKILEKEISMARTASGAKYNMVLLSDSDMPESIKKINKQSNEPLFDKNMINYLNYKRSYNSSPIFVTFNKRTVVHENPDATSKELGMIGKNDDAEVGDYKHTDKGDWIYLRLISTAAGSKVKIKSGWVPLDSAKIIEYHSTWLYQDSSHNIMPSEPGSWRYICSMGRNRDIAHYFIDVNSFEESGNEINFTAYNSKGLFRKVDTYTYFKNTHLLCSSEFKSSYQKFEHKEKYVKEKETGLLFKNVFFNRGNDNYFSDDIILLNGLAKVLEGK